MQLTDFFAETVKSKRESKNLIVCRPEEGEGGTIYRPLEFKFGIGTIGMHINTDKGFELNEAKCVMQAYRAGQPIAFDGAPCNYSDYRYEEDGCI